MTAKPLFPKHPLPTQIRPFPEVSSLEICVVEEVGFQGVLAMRHKKTWTACYSTVHCRLYSDRARLAERRTKAIRFLYLMHFVFLASASCDCLQCGSSPKPTPKFLDGILVYTPIKLLARDEIPALMRFDDIKCPPNHAWKQEPCRVSENDGMSCALKPFPRWSSAFILLCKTQYA